MFGQKLPTIILIILFVILWILCILSWLPKQYIPYHPRIFNRMYASMHNYFWIPCPLCGRYFGGHEWKETLMTSKYQGVGVCPLCEDIAREQNSIIRSFPETLPNEVPRKYKYRVL